MADTQIHPHRPPTGAEPGLLRLNIGCGSTVPATWTNVDNSPTIWLAQRPLLWRLACALRLIPSDLIDARHWARQVVIADARRRLPFATGSAAAIYSSHFLEHLTREDAVFVLREARRLLRPGGLIRTVVPDLACLVGDYQRAAAAGDERAADKLFDNLWVVYKRLDRYPAWFRPLKSFLRTDVHKWLYDEASLTAMLRDEGFVEIHPCVYRESEIPGIEDVELEGRLRGAVCLEARSP